MNPDSVFHYQDIEGCTFDYQLHCEPREAMFWSTKKPKLSDYKVLNAADPAERKRVQREIYNLDLAEFNG